MSPALVDEAVARMQTGDEMDRRHAQLVLAVARDVPSERLAPLEASASLLVSLYPALRAREVADGEALSRKELYRIGTPGRRDPLRDVAPEIHARLLPASDPEPPEVKTGDEGYVRATVTSSNGTKAWMQPVWLM